MKKLPLALCVVVTLIFSCLLTTGCRSAYIVTSITNNSGSAVKLIEVDYPSASFGVGSLAAGSQFPYRFKVQGSGEIKMQFTDATGKLHTVTGPEIFEGQQGTLAITIEPANQVTWHPVLSRMK